MACLEDGHGLVAHRSDPAQAPFPLAVARAEGIVFDLRGYPSRLSTVVFAHLIDRPIRSPKWHVPVVLRPDRQGMTFHRSNGPATSIHPEENRNSPARGTPGEYR